MKSPITAVVVLLAVAACDRPTAPAPLTRSAPTAPLLDNNDNTVKTNESVDLTGVITSPCTGEQIAYQGSAHMVNTFTQTIDGFTVSAHFNTQNLSGVGLVSGTKYQITDTYNQDETVASDPLNETAQLAEHYRVISQGSTDNFLVDLVYTFTFPPPTTTYQVKNARCEG